MHIEMEPLELVVVVALVTIIVLCASRMWWNMSIGMWIVFFPVVLVIIIIPGQLL